MLSKKPSLIRPDYPFQVDLNKPSAQGLVFLVPMIPFTGDKRDFVSDVPLTNVGNVLPDTFPEFGRTLSFNGTNQYLSYTGTVLTDEPITLCTWVWPRVNNAAVGALALGNNGANGHYLVGGTALGAVRCQKVNDAGSGGQATGGAISLYRWQHIAGVFVSDTSRTPYIDGVAGTENTTSVSDPTPDFISIGAVQRSSVVAHWDCALFDMRMYNRVLSAGEIQRLYQPTTRFEIYWQPSRTYFTFSPPAAAGNTQPPRSMHQFRLRRVG